MTKYVKNMYRYVKIWQFYTTCLNILFVGIRLGWTLKTLNLLGWIPTVRRHFVPPPPHHHHQLIFNTSNFLYQKGRSDLNLQLHLYFLPLWSCRKVKVLSRQLQKVQIKHICGNRLIPKLFLHCNLFCKLTVECGNIAKFNAEISAKSGI